MASLMIVVPLLTVTVGFASPATACLVHARPDVALPVWVCSRVQPAGPVSAAVPLFVEMNSSRVSPAWTVLGTVTVCAVRLPALLAAPTNESAGSTALAAGTGPRPSTASAATSVEIRTGTSRERVRAGAWSADMRGTPDLLGLVARARAVSSAQRGGFAQRVP